MALTSIPEHEDVAALPFTSPAVARGVSLTDFDSDWVHREGRFEWSGGEVFDVSLSSRRQNHLIDYLVVLLNEYFQHRPVGLVERDSLQMRLETVPSRRHPDVMIVLDGSTSTLTQSILYGPADICVEVVSPDSVERDYVDKAREYALGGVREYWIFDPQVPRALFFRLNAAGEYEVMPVTDGVYRTALLPDFALTVAGLWGPTYPSASGIVAQVQAMLQNINK